MSLRWNMNLWGFNNFGFSICVLVNIISIRSIKVSVLLRPRSDHLMWILSLNKLPFQVQKEAAYVSRVHFGSRKRFSTCCTSTSCHVLRLSSNLFAQGVWMDGVFFLPLIASSLCVLVCTLSHHVTSKTVHNYRPRSLPAAGAWGQVAYLYFLSTSRHWQFVGLLEEE